MNSPEVTKDASANYRTAVISQSPVSLSSLGRERELQVRVSAPVSGTNLPVIVFSHGFGSSMDAYAPLVNYWASQGFVVIQPTFLDSRTLSLNPKADHSEAVKAYLDDPRKQVMWRYRVEDVVRVLDQLEVIENAVIGLRGKLDLDRIAAAGHSFGAQTTAMLLGARVINPDGSLSQDYSDPRIKAGVLLSVGGRGGEALSPFAKEHFPHLNQRYDGLKKPALVVAGDKDSSPLSVLGPEWFTDAYYLSPGANALFTLYDGEHMLGGISGYLVRETTDENPDSVKAVRRISGAYLLSALYPENPAWVKVCTELKASQNPAGRVDLK